MSTNDNCPNCQAEIKDGLLSNVRLLSSKKTEIINEYHDQKSSGYCTKCGKELYTNCNAKLLNEKNKLTKVMKRLIHHIPVISIHTPLNWDYEILGMVTGQSTTGTGVVTEFTSSFTDFFGAQSGRHNKKLKAGEDMCFAQLKKQALDFGGNAVIATDIDYSELGSIKGMIMVCMAGTAVKLNNIEILGDREAQIIDELIVANNRLLQLEKYSTDDS